MKHAFSTITEDTLPHPESTLSEPAFLKCDESIFGGSISSFGSFDHPIQGSIPLKKADDENFDCFYRKNLEGHYDDDQEDQENQQNRGNVDESWPTPTPNNHNLLSLGSIHNNTNHFHPGMQQNAFNPHHFPEQHYLNHSHHPYYHHLPPPHYHHHHHPHHQYFNHPHVFNHGPYGLNNHKYHPHPAQCYGSDSSNNGGSANGPYHDFPPKVISPSSLSSKHQRFHYGINHSHSSGGESGSLQRDDSYSIVDTATCTTATQELEDEAPFHLSRLPMR